jgi:hypothetical protein
MICAAGVNRRTLKIVGDRRGVVVVVGARRPV